MTATRKWPTAKLGDVVDLFDAQRVPLNSRQRQERKGQFPYYGAQGIIDHIDGYIFDGRYILVAEDGENLNSKKLPLALFATGKFWVNNHAHILRGKPDIADDTFLLACLNHADIKPFVTGAAQPKLSQGNLRLIEIPLPSIAIQQRIAGIVSAYDELIENSQRRIKILESMARALYREWFVHFRFPGHESVPRVDSALGEIPQGWAVKRLTECMEVNPRVTVPREGEKPFVPMGCLSNDSMLISDIESRSGNSGAKFQNGDTLFARITPCLENGKTGFVQFLPGPNSVAFGSTEFIVLRSRSLTPEMVYLLARSDWFRGVAIKSMSGATGRQRVQEKCFDDLQLAQPPQDLLDRFSEIVEPSFGLVHELHQKIDVLRRTRDLLLPRLLSGQIDVESLSA
ncbi:MAG TPA: restriction endonuclease subunit S [Vicinamibacterales bacterium]|nr:restriction endonuclease subunit S [Vicinamibacterales bacterium]